MAESRKNESPMRSTEDSAHWQPELGAFEAAWDPEGATCLARTRDGRSPESILSDCPDRFEPAMVEFGEGDSYCALNEAQRRTPTLASRSVGSPGTRFATRVDTRS